MIFIKKYKVRLFIILTHFKDGNWYKISIDVFRLKLISIKKILVF